MLKNIKLETILISGIALIFSTYTLAAQPKSGLYVEGNVGYGKTDTELQNISTDNQNITGNINLGYKINKWLALEAGFAYFPDAKANNFNIDFATDNYYFDAAIRGSITSQSGLDLFAKAGIAAAHTSWNSFANNIDDANYLRTTGYFGLGVGYYITKRIEINIQANSTTKSGDEVPAMQAITAGLSFTL